MTRLLLPVGLALALTIGLIGSCEAGVWDDDSGPGGSASVARSSWSRCTAGTSSFAAGNWPGGCWRPYAQASPFNRALPRRPRLLRRSRRIVRGLLRGTTPQNFTVGHPKGNDGDYGHPVYYARATDPVYTIHCTRWRSSCEIDGMQVRIPAKAMPASGTDAHMAVIDQRRGWEYDFWEVHTQPLPQSGGDIWISHGGRARWGARDADGLGSAATAAHFGLDAGVIRAEEWDAATATGKPIQHALFISVRCTTGYAVYPAPPGTTASVCPSRRLRAKAPPLGARLYLKMSMKQISALRVPAWKKPILKAMARYGMIVGDTFGGNQFSFGVFAESDIQYRALGHPGRYAELGRKWDAPRYKGAYVFDIASGIRWRRKLRVAHPCVSSRSC